MNKHDNTPSYRRTIVIEKIEALIREKRAPFEARQAHVQELDAEIGRLMGKVSEYLLTPTPRLLQDARAAEMELIALQSLRPRIGELDIDSAMAEVLDSSQDQFAPLFTDLIGANADYLKQCQEKAREFRITAAALPEADALSDIQARIYTNAVTEAQRLNTVAARWTAEWSRGQISTFWCFWNIYRAIKTLNVTLYASREEIPIPEGFARPRAAMTPRSALTETATV